MPELPEVETVRRTLEEILGDHPVIRRVDLHRADIRFPIPEDFARQLKGQKILGVKRRAKYLLIETTRPTILSHLGMTGSWRLCEDEVCDKHDHCVIELEDGRRLAFRDPRRFGVLDLVTPGKEDSHRLLKSLGPEPLDEGKFDAEYLYDRSRGRKVAIKILIMNQVFVVGVGNIYASEVLFLAGIRPAKHAGKITKDEATRLVAAIRKVLKEAIRAGGSSIRDYKSASGESGSFQESHRVYDREGKPCVKCKTLIRMRVIGGRSTFWCPHCQK